MTCKMHSGIHLVAYLCIFILMGDAVVRFPSRKAWWVKQITDDVYTSVRPTETQLKLAAESGFKSIISMFNWTTSDALGEELIPTTDQSRDIVHRLAGLEFGVVHPEPYSAELNWASLESVHRFSALYSALPKPMLFYCMGAYSCSMIALLHFANTTRYDATAATKITKRDLYRKASILGFDYASEEKEASLINEVTGEDDGSVPPIRPDVSLPSWFKQSGMLKPLYKNIYVAGMIQSNQLSLFKGSGFQVIVNNRKGVIIPPDTPAQEEVVLLNVKDRTGTYTGAGRQNKDQLLTSRIDASKPNEYISKQSSVNYQSHNPLQFGDDIGYNETWEREYLTENWPFEYIHQPIGGQYKYSLALWEAYREEWEELGRRSDIHILIHCRTGYRSSVMGFLAAGYLHCKSSSWVLDRAAGMGYHFEAGTEDDVINLFREILDQNRTECDITNMAAFTPPPNFTMVVLVMAWGASCIFANVL